KFSQAVGLAPQVPQSHHNLALALAKVGRTQEAIEHMQKAVALDPDLSASLLTLGGLYQSNGQIEQAIQTYQEFLKRFPRDSEATRIANLLKGLQSVSRTMGGARSQQGIDSGGGSDYLADVTRTGVWRWPDERMPIRVYIHSGSRLSGFKPDYQ